MACPSITSYLQQRYWWQAQCRCRNQSSAQATRKLSHSVCTSLCWQAAAATKDSRMPQQVARCRCLCAGCRKLECSTWAHGLSQLARHKCAADGHVPAHPYAYALPQEPTDRAQIAQEQALQPQHVVLMLYNVEPCMGGHCDGAGSWRASQGVQIARESASRQRAFSQHGA